MAHLQEGEKPLEQPVASLPQHLRLFEVGSHRVGLSKGNRPVISTFLPLHIPTPRENRYVTDSSTSAPFSSISPWQLELMWRVHVTNNPRQASDLFTLHWRIDHGIAGDIRLYTFSV